MKLLRHLFMIVATMLVVVVGASAVNAQTSAHAATSVAAVKQKGTLVVGTSADYPPYEFTVKQNDKTKYVGFDMQIAQALAKKLGVKLVIKNMDFDSLLVALQTHKVDMVIAGMNATAERKKSVGFSNVYYSGDEAILVNKKDAAKYKTVKSLTGATVGAQVGSLQYTIAQKQIKNVKLKGLAKVSSLIIALQSGKVNAVVVDKATAKVYAKNYSSLVAITPGFKLTKDNTGSAMAFAKGSTTLVKAANQLIAQLKKNNTVEQKYLPQAAKYMQTNSKQNTMLNYWKYFAKGIKDTLIIAIISAFFGVVLGILLALARLGKNKVIKALAVSYIEFIRGTPMMVQVMFVYFGIGALIQSMPAIIAGIIAVSLNSGAYVAEVIRSGIQSIDYGQTEAARSLGLTQGQTYQLVVIPQALKNIWPALGNEFITLVKDSSIVSVIGVGELMYQTQLVQSATYQGVLPLFITMIIYFILTFTLSRIMKYFEGKMNHA